MDEWAVPQTYVQEQIRLFESCDLISDQTFPFVTCYYEPSATGLRLNLLNVLESRTRQ